MSGLEPFAAGCFLSCAPVRHLHPQWEPSLTETLDPDPELWAGARLGWTRRMRDPLTHPRRLCGQSPSRAPSALATSALLPVTSAEPCCAPSLAASVSGSCSFPLSPRRVSCLLALPWWHLPPPAPPSSFHHPASLRVLV